MAEGQQQDVADDMDTIVYLTENSGHRTYLVTYSQLDHRIFPTRQAFGYACVASFGANNVEFFCVTKEAHATQGYHYHAAIKLNKVKRWKSVKDYMKDTYDVVVNFAEAPYEGMYSGAYRYATKTDTQAFIGNC